jgi:hypothetical protein
MGLCNHLGSFATLLGKRVHESSPLLQGIIGNAVSKCK